MSGNDPLARQIELDELVTNLRAVSWRVRTGQDVPPMEKALIALCGQAAAAVVEVREQLRQARCDCHLHENQVCDVCQGIDHIDGLGSAYEALQTSLSLMGVAKQFVLHEPPYCLTFPSSNCKTQKNLVQRGCIKCQLREALGVEFAEHQPEGCWWNEAATSSTKSVRVKR